LSHPTRYSAGMKIQIDSDSAAKNCVRVLLRFGHADLVTVHNGRLELRGGSTADRTEAKEYISLFMHEAVPKFVAEN
jgi:hypothetical protein